jgi:hypothetical protein
MDASRGRPASSSRSVAPRTASRTLLFLLLPRSHRSWIAPPLKFRIRSTPSRLERPEALLG